MSKRMKRMRVHHRSIKVKSPTPHKRELPAATEDPDAGDYRSFPPDANAGLDGFK